MAKKPKSIAVIGGGIAGTSAAYALSKHGYDVTIIEQRDRLGGRIHSHTVNGAAVEMGAGFLTQDYANLLDFLAATGLNRQLYRQKGSTGTYMNGRVYMLSPRVLLASQPLAWNAKFYVFPLLFKTFTNWKRFDVHAFWRAAKFDNRSVSNIFSSAGGKNFIEAVLQPALNGYFYWTPEHTSEAMMLILCKAAFSHGTHKLEGGLQRIPEKAAEESKVLLGHTVKMVTKTAGGAYDVIIEHDGKKHTLHADGIVCATTASAVSKIFPTMSASQKGFFTSVRYSSGALIARTYKQEHTRGDKAIAFPRSEGIGLASVTLSPEPSAGDATYATVKTYASGATAARVAALPDKDLVHKLVGDMAPVHDEVLINNPKPITTHVQRWAEALPLFDVGHFKRLRDFHEGRVEDPTHAITFAGDYIGGPFMEGAFTSGLQAAERLRARLGT